MENSTPKTSTISRLHKFLRSMPTKEARDAFVAARVAAAIGLRIFNMRKKQNWSQEDLAQKAGMKQARISVLEQADYENFSFSTLRRIAAAFDVAVIIDFVSFPDFLKWSDGFTPRSIIPESYSDSLLRPAQVDAGSPLLPEAYIRRVLFEQEAKQVQQIWQAEQKELDPQAFGGLSRKKSPTPDEFQSPQLGME